MEKKFSSFFKIIFRKRIFFAVFHNNKYGKGAWLGSIPVFSMCLVDVSSLPSQASFLIFLRKEAMQIFSFSPFGYEGAIVTVEVDLRRGIPGVDMVGLADGAVRESRERMRSALLNSGFQFPPERIVISLSPADLKKEGALHEYYNPDTGEPIINKGFQNWNYLVLNMIAWLDGRTVVKVF